MSTVLVVGGTGGMGTSIVRRFAKDGFNIYFTYLKAEQSARSLADEARGFGVDAKAVALDLRDWDRTRDVVRDCVSSDDLFCAIFAAATGVHRPLREFKAKHWDWVFNANVRSFLVLFQETLVPLSQTGGSLIALTSAGSRRAVWPGYAVIGASKGALESLVRYAAVEAAALGVRVNAVSPGLVETKALDSFPDKDKMLSVFREKSPMRRLVSTEEVADCVHWLSLPEASMINGQTVIIDGGMEIGAE